MREGALHRSPSVWTWARASLIAAAISLSSQATIVVEGPAGFQAAVEACIERIMTAGGAAAANISNLAASGNVHVIQPGTGYGSTSLNNSDNGHNGTGTGTTVSWDKDWKEKFTGSDIKNDPCANLAHELSHSADADKGICDTTPGHNGIPVEEIKACGVENEFRASEGQPQRETYGGRRLP